VYTYDSVGQRTKSVVTLGGTGTYTGLTLHKLSATQTGGTATASWSITYLYDEYGKPYAGVYRDTTSTETPPAPVSFGMITTDRGDVVELLDKDGEPFAAYRYDAWGNPLGAGTDGAVGMWWKTTTSITDVNAAKAIAQRQVLRYAGYCYDSESGLYYLSARHYDPVTRQFLSKDLSRNDGEQSAYQYCGGNPVGNIDPTGYASIFSKEWWSGLRARTLGRLEHTKSTWRRSLIPALRRRLPNGIYYTPLLDPGDPSTYARATVRGSRGQRSSLGSIIRSGIAQPGMEKYTGKTNPIDCIMVDDGKVLEPYNNARTHASLSGKLPKYDAGSDYTIDDRRQPAGDMLLEENVTVQAKAGRFGYKAAGAYMDWWSTIASGIVGSRGGLAGSVAGGVVGKYVDDHFYDPWTRDQQDYARNKSTEAYSGAASFGPYSTPFGD
jgi:RHS repeat-associated protein